MSMPNTEMIRLATERFGRDRWLQGLAYATGVSERTIRRWADGSVPINSRIESHIRLACEKRERS